jgi:hypothetical protein
MPTNTPIPGIQTLGCGFNPFENALLKHKRRLWEFDFPDDDEPYVSPAGGGYYIHSGAKYAIPRGVLFSDEFREGASEADVSTSRHEVEQKLAAEASVSGGFGQFSAAFSSSYSFDRSSSNAYSFASKQFSSQLWTLSLTDIPTVELPLADDLIAAIGASPPSFRQSRDWYDRFFTAYGTHFIAAVGVGGRCLLCVSVLNKAKLSQEKIGTQLDVEYGAFVKASGKVDYSNLESEYLENRRHQEHVFGGDPTLAGQLQSGAGKFEEWSESVKQRPGVIRFTLQGIADLFPAERRAEVRAAFVDYCYRNSFYTVLFQNKDSFVDIKTQNRLERFNTATFEAWVFPTGAGSNPRGGGGMILNKERSYEIARFQDERLMWAFKQSSTDWAYDDPGLKIPEQRWSHIAVAFDAGAGEVRTYLDGNPGRSAKARGAIQPMPAKLRLGARTEGDQNFAGHMEEVRIWNTARTIAQIQRDMYTRMTGDEEGLVGLWPLNDATGNGAPDRSPSGNDGVLRNATWAEPPAPSPIHARMGSRCLSIDRAAPPSGREDRQP